MKIRLSYFLIFSIILFVACSRTTSELQQPTPTILLNQIGFYPDENKLAVIGGGDQTDFSVLTNDLKTKVFEGKLSGKKKSIFSDKQTQIADFSDLTQQGSFVIFVPGQGYSYPFEIKPHVHEEVLKGALKAFYFQRFSISLDEKYAGKWNRPFSHPDNQVFIHTSAASNSRPAGSVISGPGGWIDAGDYNKYVVNSGITMGTLLSVYEDFPEYFKTLNSNIPESRNDIPDILDETIWNLRWMLAMQDPNDGGVYHKCTNAEFDKMIMPDKAVAKRFVVQKSTAATLDFAAVTAQASRVLKDFESQLPGLADSCLRASEKAWMWAKANPEIQYDQNTLNKQFDPDINTGAYGDRNFSDEFVWASAELFISTGKKEYLQAGNLFKDKRIIVPSWSQVKLLGFYSLIRFEHKLPFITDEISDLKKLIVMKADSLVTKADASAYQTVMGLSAKDFIWGSNSVAANQGILLLQAFRITKEKRFLKYGLFNLDYLLGRNVTGYSFITGFGKKTPMHIHHRPSESDGIADPVPGLLAGGPNPGMQDKCHYPSSIPDEAYVDNVCSYASNEVAINWNAPLVYLAGAVEALHQEISNK
jgi:endoglucanase